MPDVTPSGPWSKAADAVRTLLAAQSAFRTWAGHAGDGTSTLAHIHIGPLADADLDSLAWPWVQLAEPDSPEKDDAVALDTFVRPVAVEVIAGKAIPSTWLNDARNAAVWMNDDHATLAGCLRDLSGGETGGVRYVHRGVEELLKPGFVARSENTTAGRYEAYEAKFKLVFGPGG